MQKFKLKLKYTRCVLFLLFIVYLNLFANKTNFIKRVSEYKHPMKYRMLMQLAFKTCSLIS